MGEISTPPQTDPQNVNKRIRKKAKGKKKKADGSQPQDIAKAEDDKKEEPGPDFSIEDAKESAADRQARKRALREARRKQPSQPDSTAPAGSPQKGKKRKHSAEAEDTVTPEDTTSAAAVEPPKKKHKNRTEFADPRGDEALNSQARKALEYVFTQFNRPKKWKFNKARQNWLIRNVWQPEALSDLYFPLAVKYLCNVQGGSREKLIETCQSYLNSEPTEGEQKETTPKDLPTSEQASIPTPPLKSILKPTPGPLIAGPLIDTPMPSLTEGTSGAAGSLIAPVKTLAASQLADTRRTRAQALLDVLISKEESS